MGKELTALVHCDFKTEGDVGLLKRTLESVSDKVDSVMLVLSGLPGSEEGLSHTDKRWIAGLSSRPASSDEDTMRWIAKVVRGSVGSTVSTVEAVFVDNFDPSQCLSEAFGRLDSDWVVLVEPGEEFEPRITRGHLDRLMSHPNKKVGAWSFSSVSMWDTSRAFRVDSIFGDGGSYQDPGSQLRMIRKGWGEEREASVRMRSFSLMSSEGRSAKASTAVRDGNTVLATKILDEEGMRLQPFVEGNSVGLSMLAYSGESPDDYAKMFDQLYGAVDHIVVVWTDEDKPSSEFCRVFGDWGAHVVMNPLRKDIAKARNAGIDELERLGADWHLFLDPDESFVGNGPGLIRRMAEVSNSFGWLVKFVNTHGDGTSSESETIRMTKIGHMRMSGRVHESFSKSTDSLIEMGIHPQIRYATFSCVNSGQSISNEKMQEKLDKYTEMLLLELGENPSSAGAWTALGLQCENDGDEGKAMECYHNAMACSGRAYLPCREAASIRLREARVLMEECLSRLSASHGYYDSCEKIVSLLRTIAPDRPLMGAAQERKEAGVGRVGRISFSLPDFPGV